MFRLLLLCIVSRREFCPVPPRVRNISEWSLDRSRPCMYSCSMLCLVAMASKNDVQSICKAIIVSWRACFYCGHNPSISSWVGIIPHLPSKVFDSTIAWVSYSGPFEFAFSYNEVDYAFFCTIGIQLRSFECSQSSILFFYKGFPWT